MRDILNDILKNQSLDPVELARRSVRPQVRKRFYTAAGVGEGPDAYPILLDGKPIRTPARRMLAVPTGPLAKAISDEWNAQGENVDPARMPLTRLTNTVIDGVADKTDAVAEEVARYLGSDLLFYRAEGPQGLVARQGQHWDPVLEWAHETLGARFILAEGVMFVAQPERAIAAARAAIPDDPWRLGAVSSITSLTGSALLALALLRGRLATDEAWAAAHVDEDWQREQWGRDDLAEERRAFRFADMQAAATVLDLVRPDRHRPATPRQ